MYAVPQPRLKQFASNNVKNKHTRYTIPDEQFRVADGKLYSEDVSRKMEAFEGEKTKSNTIYQRISAESSATLADFKVIRKVGRGSFGIVYLVQRAGSEELYAMKQLEKNVVVQSGSIECTRLEKEILRTCCHPFLACLDFVFQTTTSIYFVMKYYR